MTLTDELLVELGDSGLEQIAGMLGTDTTMARDVVEAVSSVIVGGMARSARHPDGADALRAALDDHVDTDPFTGDVASLTRDGHNILGHVLGGQGTEQAADGLARFSGVDPGLIMRLLPLVAPMIMSLLANRAESRGMNAGAMADDLDREQSGCPGELGELLQGLLDAVFGGGVPAQGGPYESRSPTDMGTDMGTGTSASAGAGTGTDMGTGTGTVGRRGAPDGHESDGHESDGREEGDPHEVAPGTSNPDW
ncbi:DUF937 domain-containing protein [Nonomuraea angiospora]|uniref:DUF937 domain-containing protein n=1 Tax=Nonomuraea angiospora TaxID=46172 RepID=UPI0033D2EAA4